MQDLREQHSRYINPESITYYNRPKAENKVMYEHIYVEWFVLETDC